MVAMVDGWPITDIRCTARRIERSYGSTWTISIPRAHDDKIALYEDDLEVSLTYVVIHFVNGINVMYFQGWN